MPELLNCEFCRATREYLDGNLAQHVANTEIGDLIKMMQKTMEFEQQMHDRFNKKEGGDLKQKYAIQPEMKTKLHRREFNFKSGAENISKCFAPYL
jgi:hypothetical protein